MTWSQLAHTPKMRPFFLLCAAVVATSASVGQPSPQPTDRQPLWLDHPPASPVTVIAALAITTSADPEVAKRSCIEQARNLGADFVLQIDSAEATLTRADLGAANWPAATIPGQQNLQVFRVLFLLRDTEATAFFNGYFDPATNRTRPEEAISLANWAPGQAYERRGLFVRSPWAPAAPPIDVTQLPLGSLIVCPHTKRIFALR